MRRVRGVASAAVTLACYLYPLVLAVLALVLRTQAEGNAFWMVALYAPAIGYLLPALLVVPLWVFRGPAKAFAALLAGVVLCVFGSMGAQMHLPKDGQDARVVVTMNVDSAYQGVPEVASSVLSHRPDLVFLQEVGSRGEELAQALRRALPHAIVEGQFVVASRFPLSDLVVPGATFVRGRERVPRFVRVRVNFPEGSIAAYNVHPISPRPAFMAVRGPGFRSQISSGRLFGPEARDAIWKNVEVRQFELSTAAESAARETLPVVLAGDLNLPGNSRFFSATFGFLQDSFVEAGFGLGYTYPAKIPFLRLDRILTSPSIRALSFKVDCKGYSDHFCVIGKLDFSPN